MERAKLSPAISISVAGAAITVISLWYGQNHGWLPEAASQNAPLVDGLFNLMMTISVWLFLAIQGVIVLAIIKFRKQPGDETDGPPIEGNLSLELVWTAIPVVIVMVLAVYSFDVYQQMGGLDPMASHDHMRIAQVSSGSAIAGSLDGDQGLPHGQKVALGIGASPASEGMDADVTIDVMGLQYAWLFTYPGNVMAGELHVPAGRDIQLNLQAQDVLHAFWVPQFRLKQDAIPGRMSQLRFHPETPGTYPIVCAELCGPFHGAMRSTIVVDPPEEYDAWYQTQIASAIDSDATDSRVATAIGVTDLSDADRLALHPNAPAINAKAIAQMAHAHHNHPNP
ncbi:MAG: cytochrome c oxidase subunit II [Oscillatoriales cyanobacterium]|nr:MAG: cytochrome c oxidase subunit II [Oscillatoriales cyanobacterium]